MALSWLAGRNGEEQAYLDYTVFEIGVHRRALIEIPHFGKPCNVTRSDAQSEIGLVTQSDGACEVEVFSEIVDRLIWNILSGFKLRLRSELKIEPAF